MRSLLGRFHRPFARSADEQLLLMNNLGDGSTLSLDFTTMGNTLDPRLTLTRASNATFINASGLVATASNNVARFDHDPTTLSPRGLLIEGSAVNRLFQSSAFSTSPWGPSGYDLSGTGYTSPDGSTLALRWTAGTGAISPGNVQLCSNVTSTSVTLSVWWRNGNHTNSTPNNLRRVAIRNSTTSTILLDVSIVNPATVPSVSYNTGSTGASLTAYQDGWYRLVLTVSSGITSGNNIQAYIGGLFGSVTGAGEYCYWWGAMLEDGSGASSYIPTAASQGSRAADECSMTGTNFASWFTNNSEGSFLVRYSMNNPSAFLGVGIDRYAYEVSNSSGTSRVFCNASYRVTVAGDAGRFPRVFDLGTIDLAPSLVATAAQNTAFAWGYKSNDNHLAAVGVTANDTSGSLQTGVDRLHLGASRTFGSTTYLQGCISLLKYWPTRLPNAQLQSLTT